MEIVDYKNSSDIDEKYIPSLLARQVECWWSEPFWEYKVCKSEDCNAIFSLEKVCWNISNLRAWIIWNDFCCTECGSQTEFIYANPEFLLLIREYIKWKVSSVLLIDEAENVEGFWVVKKTNLWWLLDLEFATRPDSYDKEQVLEQISHSLFGKKNASDEDVICLHQLFVSELFRWWNTSFDILKKLISLNEEYRKVPFLLETRFDSKFYPISRTMWVNDISSDKYWYVIQWCFNYWRMIDFFVSNQSFYSEINLPQILKFKEEAKAILSKNSSFSWQKFY